MTNKFNRPLEALTKALSGGVKAKPHSTLEGRTAAAKRRLRRLAESQTSPLVPFKPKMPKALKDKWKKIKR